MVMALSGCSFAFARGGRSHVAKDGSVEWSHNYRLPVLDLVAAVPFALFAVGQNESNNACAADWSCGDGPSQGTKNEVVVFTAIAAVLAVSAVYGFIRIDPAAAPAPPDRPDPAPPAPPQQPKTAWQLTQDAAAAARAGDCETARKADSAVRGLDASYHDTVFVRDPAIARCLAATSAGN